MMKAMMSAGAMVVLVGLSVGLGCGEDEEEVPTQDMAPPVGDLVVVTDMSQADMTPVRPAPQGPQDCFYGEWYQPGAPACQTCPVASLGCDALVFDDNALKVPVYRLEFSLDESKIQPVSVGVRVDLVANSCVGPGIDCLDQTIEFFSGALEQEDGSYRTLFFPQGGTTQNEIALKTLEITDRCGDVWVFQVKGAIDAFGGRRVTEPFSCVSASRR